MTRQLAQLIFTLCVFHSAAANALEYKLSPGTLEQELRERLAAAAPGDILRLPAGRFEFAEGLTLGVREVTIRGTGRQKTILDFTAQTGGAQGFLIRASDVSVEGLSIVNPSGDGLVVRASRNTVIRDVGVEWTNPDLETHGGYGIYPVENRGVLVENCFARGARDAGIYVGQSGSVVLRNNHVEGNSVGLDIENSTGVQAVSNTAVGNSVGIVVSARPHLMQRRSFGVQLEGNRVEGNNLSNFAAAESHVSSFSDGIGILVIAAERTTVKNNALGDHNRSHVMLLNFASLGRNTPEDPLYRAFLVETELKGNGFSTSAGDAPVVSRNWRSVRGIDVTWDGRGNPRPIKARPKRASLCMNSTKKVRYLDLSQFEESVPAGAGRREFDFRDAPPRCD